MTQTATGAPPRRPWVVAAYDGSAGGKAALAWAADYVRTVGGTLDVVMAWHWPPSYGYPVAVTGFDPRVEARELVEKAVADLHLPPDRIRAVVTRGPAARVLVDHAADADLLVLGSRGHGGFAGLLLGSVSTHCAQHAKCAVVVVR